MGKKTSQRESSASERAAAVMSNGAREAVAAQSESEQAIGLDTRDKLVGRKPVRLDIPGPGTRAYATLATNNLDALLWWLRDECNDEKPQAGEVEAWVEWMIGEYDCTEAPDDEPEWDLMLDPHVVVFMEGFEQNCRDTQTGWMNLNGSTAAKFNKFAKDELKRILAERLGTGTVLDPSNLKDFLWWLRAGANADKPDMTNVVSWAHWKIDSYTGGNIPAPPQPSWSSQLSAQVRVFLEAFEQACYYAQGGWANLNGNPADLNPPAEAQVKRVLDRCPPPMDFGGV